MEIIGHSAVLYAERVKARWRSFLEVIIENDQSQIVVAPRVLVLRDTVSSETVTVGELAEKIAQMKEVSSVLMDRMRNQSLEEHDFGIEYTFPTPMTATHRPPRKD